jgi:adhesin/invasin
LQLEDAYGNIATSSGTTTLTLSDSNKGFFAGANGVAGTSTLSVTFAAGSGTATAYYGDTTAGTDTITAKNGTTTWGSTTVTPVAGPATSIQVSVVPTAPTTSRTTNTSVTMQLVDQYGNAVSATGVSFSLSNSGAGFFATRNGNTGTSTLTLAAGVTTAFFGDNTKQSVTITVTAPSYGISATTPAINV